MFDINSFKAKASKLNSEGGIPFMENRSHGGILPEDGDTTISNFGFITGDDGPYVVIDLAEYPDFFFFGGSVLTEKFTALKGMLDDSGADIASLEGGIPVRFQRKKNKTGKKEYTTCFFYPEA